MSGMITFRSASLDDSHDLFGWRNDPLTRAASGSQDPVSRSEHDRWFAASLASARRWIYIAVDTADETRVGMCRFDLDDDGDSAEVSINLDPARRGTGLAYPVLEGAIARFRSDTGSAIELTATIRATNEASARTFRKAGFVLASSGAPFDYYVLAQPADSGG
jgi:RimJ/RimL family protein N-acetyltransferase